MTYFHPEEEFQFGVLSVYDDEHPGTHAAGDSSMSCRCRFFLPEHSSNRVTQRPDHYGGLTSDGRKLGQKRQ
jgi:hypothetical protein